MQGRSKRQMFWDALLCLLVLIPRAGWAQQSSLNQPGWNLSGSVSARPVGNLEDWGSLSPANSELIPDRPLLGEKDNNPQFTRELLQVKWRQGDPIDLYVIRPKGVAKPPAILYLYSYPSETAIFRNDVYCANATKDGFAAIGFVSALTGHRYGRRTWNKRRGGVISILVDGSEWRTAIVGVDPARESVHQPTDTGLTRVDYGRRERLHGTRGYGHGLRRNADRDLAKSSAIDRG